MLATAGKNAPEIFLRWAAIATLSGAMERRFHCMTSSGPIFPNVFVTLIAPPGGGKTQAISETSALWRGTKIVKTSPKSVSSATVIDALEKSFRGFINPASGELIEYHAMSMAVSEFGVTFKEYDPGMLSLMSDLYDGSDEPFTELKRTGKVDKSISDPLVTMIAGATPGFLLEALPEVAWVQGFMARNVLVYSKESIDYDVSGIFTNDNAKARTPHSHESKEYLKAICDGVGVFRWEEEAQAAFRAWYAVDYAPVPDHPKLENYSRRRMFHVVKLAMISSVSRNFTYMINLSDFERAREWLIEAEETLPDFFRSMRGKNDNALLMELHGHMLKLQEKYKVESLPEKTVYGYLSEQVPGERVPRLLELAINIQLFKRAPGIRLTALKVTGEAA